MMQIRKCSLSCFLILTISLNWLIPCTNACFPRRTVRVLTLSITTSSTTITTSLSASSSTTTTTTTTTPSSSSVSTSFSSSTSSSSTTTTIALVLQTAKPKAATESPHHQSKRYTCGQATNNVNPLLLFKSGQDSFWQGDTIMSAQKWPWLVAIYLKSSATSEILNFKCTGTLVDAQLVLTAASCVANQPASLIAISIGSNHLIDAQDHSSKLRGVAQVIAHRMFKFDRSANDIALIKLKTKIANYLGEPICLPYSFSSPSREDNSESLFNKRALVIGWGSINNSSSVDPILKQLVVRVMQNTTGTCQNDARYCVKHRVEEKKLSSVCWLNLGAPLIFYEKGHWTIYGIASSSNDAHSNSQLCKPNRPRVYSRVPKHMEWINRERLKLILSKSVLLPHHMTSTSSLASTENNTKNIITLATRRSTKT